MKMAVIGTSAICERFLSAAQFHPEFTLGAVCGSSLAKAESFAQKYGGVSAVDDYRKLASIPGLEGVYIATPNNLHCAATVDLLRSGVPVLCEKPLAPTLAQAEEMIAASAASGTPLLEGIMPLYLPNFLAIREHLGELGHIRKALMSYCQYSSRYDSYRSGIVENAFKPEKMGGSLMDIGIYPLYQAIALFGPPQRVQASATLLETGVDGSGAVILTYPEMEITILHSKVTFTSTCNEIQGEDGSLLFSSGSVPLEVELRTRQGDSRSLTREQRPERMWYELDEFIRCVASGERQSPLAPHALMLEVYRITQEIRRQTGVVYPGED